MKYTIHIGDQPIALEHDNIDSTINVDELTTINTSNLFGEAVTASASANRIGLLKAEVEKILADAKLELKIYEAEFRADRRKEAANPANNGCYIIKVGGEEVKVKSSEKALETCFEADPEWIKLKKATIKAERNVGALTSLHWSTQDKCRKLNGLTSGVTPEEFVAELIEGKINGILIKK